MLLNIRTALFSIWTYRVVRIFLGGIFIWSGATKIMDIEGFARLISVYELVPDPLLVPVAVGLPLLEAVAGIGLVMDGKYWLSVITGMLILFTGVLWFGILKGLEIDCGCFSAGELKEHSSLRFAFYRDIGFLFLAFYLYLHRWLRKGKGDSKYAYTVRPR